MKLNHSLFILVLFSIIYCLLSCNNYKTNLLAGKEELEKNGSISDRNYPLNWEKDAKQADYKGIHIIFSEYEETIITLLHNWYKTEIFLYPGEII